MNVTISAIGTANPSHKFSQDKIADFMIKAHQLEGREKERLLALYRATGIKRRYSVLKDYGMAPEGFEFYSKQENLEPFPTTVQRNAVYQQEALSLAKAAVYDCLPEDMDYGTITHLITVSCTGLYAPGLDIELVEGLELNPHVQRTAINFMGCYAAFNAIKVGQAMCQSQDNSRVLIICLELCTLHFQKDTHEDFILSNSLFGDGAAALLLEGNRQNGLDILATYSDLLPEGAQEMAWQVGNFGFEMRLSRYVPDLIADGIEKLTSSLMRQGPWQLSEIDYFAIHPGGKRILECIQQALNISSHQNRFAYEVLRNFGNMSSPTILFVLKEIWNNLKMEDQDKRILCFAFGPGLTMESMILQVNSKHDNQKKAIY